MRQVERAVSRAGGLLTSEETRTKSFEAVSTQRKMEGARIKGLLADCRFDLDLLGSKYERLLDERATIGLSRELVDAARRDMGGSFQDDGSAASSAKILRRRVAAAGRREGVEGRGRGFAE